EVFKFLVIYIFIWNNKEFNDIFDGIVYATYASLGFALIENILYVYSNGASVGIARAFTAVPAHAVFGITMGFFFGLAKFSNKKYSNNLALAILVPILLHGFYDFILMMQNNYLLILFIPYLIVILWVSFKMMKKHSDNSKFSNKNNSVSG
ncbi:MAG: PrsW family glutamic-type intramembrane protease, partial [Bacteroidota bacterium]|nr:PrsW family glutamic-type intramembrane protease [Bacteroidota bacterium]